jgi:hypothetical protein
MKKIILLGAFAATTLVSAKNVDEINPRKEGEKKESVKEAKTTTESKADDPEGKMNCYEYAMFIPCTNTYITDTQCWGPGTGTATWEDAWNCIGQNGVLAVEFFCNP